MSVCANCGTQLMVGNSSCTRCGTATQGNVYSPPKANLETPADTTAHDHEQLERMRTGQRLVILAILISFAMVPFNLAAGTNVSVSLFVAALSLANLVLIVIGVWRLSRGHGYGGLAASLFCLLGIVPLLGLILMIGLSVSATGKLRKAGYRVGLLGAKAKAAT